MVVTPQLIGRAHFSITPSDSADLDDVATGGIYVGAAGDVKFRDLGGTDVTWVMQAGGMIPVAAVRVLDTGTTATGLVGVIA